MCSALHAMGLCNEAGFSKFHHLLNRAHWSSLRTAKILLFMLLPLVQGGLPIVLFIDEILERRRGKKSRPRTITAMWFAPPSPSSSKRLGSMENLSILIGKRICKFFLINTPSQERSHLLANSIEFLLCHFRKYIVA